jgi:hypothetical protein
MSTSRGLAPVVAERYGRRRPNGQAESDEQVGPNVPPASGLWRTRRATRACVI